MFSVGGGVLTRAAISVGHCICFNVLDESPG